MSNFNALKTVGIAALQALGHAATVAAIQGLVKLSTHKSKRGKLQT